MAATVDILIKATDAASDVIKRTANVTNSVADAMTRMVVQERNNRILEEARKQFDNLTESEKKWALAAYDAAEASAKQTSQSKNAIGTFTELKSKIDLIQQGVRVFAGVFDQAMDLGKAGSSLLYAQTKFDRLAASIGTTSSALKNDLRAATKGLVSDAELVGSAGDFMALGLAKSRDEVVRLTKVAGALGMDMNQLVLTLTNQTTMRFDALGVSVDGFDAKVKKLKDSGMDASAAFKEAFLQQAEEQVARLGEKADSSAAAFARLEASSKNLGDALKQQLAPALASAADAATILLTGNQQITAAYDNHNREVIKTAKSYQEYYTEMRRVAEATGQWNINMTTAEMEGMGKATEDAAASAGILTQAEWENQRAIDGWNSSQREAMAALENTNAVQQTSILQTWEAFRATDEYKKQLDAVSAATAAVNEAQLKFNESFGDKVVSALDKAGVKGQKYEDALALIDTKLGTTHLAQKKANDSLDAAIKKFAQTGNIDDFSAALEANKSEWEKLDGNLAKAKASLEGVRKEFANLIANFGNANGLHIEIVADIVTGGGGGESKQAGTQTTGRHGGYVDSNAASGADFVVPAGYPNDSYRLGLTTGEHVVVEPAGQSSTNTTLTIGQVVLPGVTNARQFYAELTQVAANKARAGAAYAGV